LLKHLNRVVEQDDGGLRFDCWGRGRGRGKGGRIVDGGLDGNVRREKGFGERNYKS